MSTPSEFYRHAVDLNRFSNAEAKQIAIAYNRLILQAVADLQILVEDERAFDRQTRLREIVRQLRASLDNWAGESSALLAGELQGLATFEEQFIRAQLLEMVPEQMIDQVKALQIDPAFARAVVMTDPIEIGMNVLSDDLLAAVGPSPATFRLTATQGAQITLPNGSTVSKAFRGIAESQAELFTKTVQSGFLAGDSGPQMARRLKGRLKFADFGPLSVRQLAQAGGQLTAVANHQVNTLVRTSVNQVANAISQATYKANAEITEKYKYVATLDSRTSARCRALDQQVFAYGKGPLPPQHFNCRSTTVPEIDYAALGMPEPPPSAIRRPGIISGPMSKAAKTRTVPANQSYGEWLQEQGDNVKRDVLGPSRIPYWNKLVKKYGPEDAIRKFVANDGSELTLKQLKARYGQP
jgi:SPP1 gp7 family putative phage head morphogenesis protein